MEVASFDDPLRFFFLPLIPDTHLPPACGMYEALFSRARPAALFSDDKPCVDVETLALSKTKQAEAAAEEKKRAKEEEKARQAVRIERERREQERQNQQADDDTKSDAGADADGREAEAGDNKEDPPAAEGKGEAGADDAMDTS